ncbi:MAG: efflux RND transporter periplasmic adaptor subunit, partial [Candidatus Binatia bacterium]
REAELKDAEARAGSAEQERKLQVARAEETLSAARQRASLAASHLAAFEKGNGPLAVREAEVHAADAGAELDRARRDLADVETMLGKGFVSRAELERARARVQELERKSGLAGDRLSAARDVVFPRDLEQARDDARAMQDAVARAEGVLYHTHEFYRAALEGAMRKVDTARAAAAAAESALQKTLIAAPLDGFLILQELPFESGRRKPQIGDAVWLGQPIATLPDLSQMVVTTRIREVDLPKIRGGTPARIGVEAVPDARLAARVDAIGSLAVAGEGGPWKFFDVRLALDGTDSRLRPGMSTRVSFLLDAAAGAVVIPIDAVFGDERSPVCFVRRGDEIWEERVDLGKRDDTHVEIRAGLAVGDEVLLMRPRGSVRRPARPVPNA